ncbi:hypothetical protein C9994_03170 [Marivirga lumbricoides]|uniref:PEP-CTERM sorting domain-containing protein n=1 Tax=Marivirga lumbricoides TaxID=1046115 RepID=A0A2T4DU95_9BACT|nr:hypothetical protein C9994_03170 [Marivirga lumbricoides]
MKSLLSIYLLAIATCAFTACDDPSGVDTNNFTYDFESSTEGWTANYSDYPAEWDKDRFEFTFERTDLPEETNEDSKALMLSGRNISDDLFMFVKTKITGLEPNKNYSAIFEIELASQYPEASVGIGGSPGGSVFLKAGGSTIEPDTIMEDGSIRMNIDKGEQALSGSQMKVLGTVGIEGNEFNYQLITLSNTNDPLEIQSNALGSLWVIVGTDSGFEGTTTLYYNRIHVRLQ